MREPSLSWTEFFCGVVDGAMRQAVSAWKGRKDRFRGEFDPWTVHIEGACAERLVGKSLGLYPNPNGAGKKDDGSDVGPYGVRSTIYDDGHLLLYPHDKDDQAHILVAGAAPHGRIAGWIYGRDGKLPELWREEARPGKRCDRPAFWVPQERLQPMSKLPAAGDDS